MRRNFSSSLVSSVGTAATLLLTATLPIAAAIDFTSVPSPNLDINSLGRVAFAGNFDAASLYQFVGQNEQTFSSNGSQSILARFPNGAFTSLSMADAYIEAMCPFVNTDGELQGIMIGGNFSGIGDVQSSGVAMFDPNSGTVTEIPGLNGRVSALYCDKDTGSVFVGGSFSGGNSTNALVWNGEWQNLPFAGFNGPVGSIVKANGQMVFGGAFTGLGNTSAPKNPDKQQVPLSSGNITSAASSSTEGFSDPTNIICKTGDGGAGNVWLLEDNTAGSWSADFGFGFEPTKLRLYNTDQDGRGTRTWRYTAFPIDGIMNFTYTNPQGEQAFCDAECPLPQGNTSYQDFQFVNQVGMNEFRIDISDWYGLGGGLAGIELYQDDIYSYAINDFNQPVCQNGAVKAENAPSSTTTGAWKVSPSLVSSAEYLSVNLTGDVNPDDTKVVFTPNVIQSGNYSITVFTPGCSADGTCDTRGRVNVTANMGASSTNSAAVPTSSILFQTNNFDKYDQIYLGYIDADNSPSVTLQPASGQTGPLNVVAQRVRFELLSNSTGGLNGLFEFDPTSQEVDSDFSTSTIDTTGADLDDDASFTSLVVDGDTLYAGGDFSSDKYSNILRVTGDNANSLTGGGLNSAVLAMYRNGSNLYVGGNFTNAQDNSVTGLNRLALYSTTDNTWTPLGAGVNGDVETIVPFELNITADQAEGVLAISGLFDTVLETGQNASFPAEGLAVWVPSRQNWLQNLNDNGISLSGKMMAQTEVPGMPDSPLFAGSVSSQALSASGALGLRGDSDLSLQSLPVPKFSETPASTSSNQKRATTEGQNVTGSTAGLIHTSDGLNITIIAGHFSATGSNGENITNLLFLNGTDTVTGLDSDEVSSDSTFYSLGVKSGILYAGGQVSGNVNSNRVNGIISYDLAGAKLSSTQPDDLSGSDVMVNAIAPHPKDSNLYVGGNFTGAGSLNCPSLCVFDTSRNQWNQPGGEISGIVNAMEWVSGPLLVLAGDITVGNNKTKVAHYDPKKMTFQSIEGADQLPGTVTAIALANKEGTEVWAAGQASDGTAFLQRYDGSKWLTTDPSFGTGSVIRGIQSFDLHKKHAKNDVIDQGQALLILGSLVIPGFGNASSALFNGTDYTPFILSTTSQNTQGTLYQAFVEKDNFFQSNNHHLALGFIVLIGLAIALALIFLITAVGFIMERQRRRKEGYMPAPTSISESHNMERIPPSQLFGTMGQQQGPMRI